MNRFEYLAATTFLRILGRIFSLLPIRTNRVVLASPRPSRLEGNLRYIHAAMLRLHPQLDYVLLLEPYSYRIIGKVLYLLRLVRGMYYLCTSRLFVIDNAYFPVHVAPHRAGTTVIQVWHAAGALKRFGLATAVPPREPERSFLHRHYDFVIASSEASRAPYAEALRTPIEQVLALGSPRTDLFFDERGVADARQRLFARYTSLRGRRVVLYAPTFRGRGERKRAAPGLDAAALRRGLPVETALVLKVHPNLDPGTTPTSGYDAVIDPATEINELFAITDVLITDYSSVIFDWALLRRPLILLVGDLARYRVDPGLYLDYETEMIGTQVTDSAGVLAALLENRFDLAPYDAFIQRHLGKSQGDASTRFVQRFLDDMPASRSASPSEARDRLRSHVTHE
jgi:teichoic acid ribitol-phosphate primase